MREPLCRFSPTISARRPKVFTANHSLCSCSSPPLSFHRSVVATENCAMAVPCWLYFTSGSRPRFPINITFCIFCCSFLSLSLACPLRAPACTPARHAAIAGSAPHHQRTADVAGGRVSHLDKFSERSNRVTAIGVYCWLNGDRRGFEQFALVTSQEPEFEPPRDVVHKRLGVADLWISGPSAGLEPHMAEFFAKHTQWNAVLQGKRDHRCEGIHQPGDGRALLCHRDEDFSWEPVFVDSDREVSLLPGDGKVMGECPPLVRQMPPNRARGFGTFWTCALVHRDFTFVNRSYPICRCHIEPHFPQAGVEHALAG